MYNKAVAMTDAEMDAFINEVNPETVTGVPVARVVVVKSQVAQENPSEGQLADLAAQKRFVMAGNATFTLVSQKTGTRYTYKVSRAKENPQYKQNGPTYFVALLTGSDNQCDYTYMGMLTNYGAMRWGVKQTRSSKVAPNNASWKAITWFLDHVCNGEAVNGVEVFHAGKCGRCGRTLTVPSSIEMGLGPECAGM
jgi:hypothetical protein